MENPGIFRVRLAGKGQNFLTCLQQITSPGNGHISVRMKNEVVYDLLTSKESHHEVMRNLHSRTDLNVQRLPYSRIRVTVSNSKQPNQADTPTNSSTSLQNLRPV